MKMDVLAALLGIILVPGIIFFSANWISGGGPIRRGVSNWIDARYESRYHHAPTTFTYGTSPQKKPERTTYTVGVDYSTYSVGVPNEPVVLSKDDELKAAYLALAINRAVEQNKQREFIRKAVTLGGIAGIAYLLGL
jgi:hypothetical protein